MGKDDKPTGPQQAGSPGANGRKRRREGPWSHWITQLGIYLVVISILGAAGFALAEWILPTSSPYLGLLLAIPLLTLTLGIVLIPIGYLRERRLSQLGIAPLRVQPITIDLSLSRHRTILLLIGIGAAACLIVFVVGSFATFQAMDSNAFCGQTCHQVMRPEYTVYQSAPHASVKCVECHIGSGVEYYIHAKFSGLRRLAAMVTGNIQRPIPTPVADFRPAKEVCLNCHWDGRLVGYKEHVYHYFTQGADSPEVQLRLLLKIGGPSTPYYKGYGVHYHMLAENKVEYIAKDRQRQEVTWVRSTHKDGSVVEYNHQDYTTTPEQRKTLPVRQMDCLDCHNRPAHNFKAPIDMVDSVLASGALPHDLPFIKVRAVKALDGNYASNAEAMKGIADSMTDYYKESAPEVLAKKGQELTASIVELQTLYQANFFPEMKAKWSAFPNNIGHRDWPGCFRCHTDKMVSAQGKALFTDCTTCHLVLAQGKSVEKSGVVNFNKGEAFVHPGFSDQIKEYNKCIDCHTGGADLY